MRDKPIINRAEERRAFAARCELAARVADVAALLSPGEKLGPPTRSGDRVVLPVVSARREGTRPEDARVLARALME